MFGRGPGPGRGPAFGGRGPGFGGRGGGGGGRSGPWPGGPIGRSSRGSTQSPDLPLPPPPSGVAGPASQYGGGGGLAATAHDPYGGNDAYGGPQQRQQHLRHSSSLDWSGLQRSSGSREDGPRGGPDLKRRSSGELKRRGSADPRSDRGVDGGVSADASLPPPPGPPPLPGPPSSRKESRHSSRDKDKGRDRDRQRHKSSRRSSDRDRGKERGKSSEKSVRRDRDRDRDGGGSSSKRHRIREPSSGRGTPGVAATVGGASPEAAQPTNARRSGGNSSRHKASQKSSRRHSSSSRRSPHNGSTDRKSSRNRSASDAATAAVTLSPASSIEPGEAPKAEGRPTTPLTAVPEVTPEAEASAGGSPQHEPPAPAHDIKVEQLDRAAPAEAPSLAALAVDPGAAAVAAEGSAAGLLPAGLRLAPIATQAPAPAAEQTAVPMLEIDEELAVSPVSSAPDSAADQPASADRCDHSAMLIVINSSVEWELIQLANHINWLLHIGA